jgi:rod shape determining protein RodA
MGAQRWVDLIIFKGQPSELTKLFFPIFATYYFQTQRDSLDYAFKDFLPLLGILGVSIILILKQPDLGTALILAFSSLIMLWFAGIGKKFFVILFLSSALMAPVMWGVLKPYQKKRIIVFLGEGDARNERYQLEQSKIAIGSGGLTGKGLLKGTQNQLRFLPESRTDFIFSIICEEWGFTGALIILSLYLVLFIRFLFVVPTIQSPFVQLLAVGLITPLMVSTVVNICMVIGFLPIVGIPLPLMSYGISSLWITFASLGWFHNIAIRRFYIGEY